MEWLVGAVEPMGPCGAVGESIATASLMVRTWAAAHSRAVGGLSHLCACLPAGTKVTLSGVDDFSPGMETSEWSEYQPRTLT